MIADNVLNATSIGASFGLKSISQIKGKWPNVQRQVISKDNTCWNNEWAASYLRQAGLIVSPQRGKAVATDEGNKFLELYPEQITVNDLKTIQSFVDFQNRWNKKTMSPVLTFLKNDRHRHLKIELARL